jgi:hypothetical protein
VSSLASYQLSNYNVYPTPVITSSAPLPKQITVHAHLIDENTKTVIVSGFQGGEVKVMKSDTTTLKFKGLKWNKIGFIKAELNKSTGILDRPFRIQFSLGTVTVSTNPFWLVSTTQQVPRELRDEVRPMKKNGETKKYTKKRQWTSSESDDEEFTIKRKRPIRVASVEARSK